MMNDVLGLGKIVTKFRRTLYHQNVGMTLFAVFDYFLGIRRDNDLVEHFAVARDIHGIIDQGFALDFPERQPRQPGIAIFCADQSKGRELDTVLSPTASIDVGGPDFRLRGQDQIGVAAERGPVLAVKEQRRTDVGNRIAPDDPQPNVISVLRL